MTPYSLKRLFVSTAMIALGTGLYCVPIWMGCGYARAHGPPLSEPVQWILCLGGAAFFGAGTGNIFYRLSLGAIIGPTLLLAVSVVVSMGSR